MAVVTIRQLLDSGVHFGHQTRRWNPKMKRFIFTERSGIYIIDLQQSLGFVDKAYDFVKETVAHGGTILFVGTKKQAQESIAEQATRVGQPYVNQRWLGGLLTNFQTVSKRLARMKELEELDFEDTAKSGFTKKEMLIKKRELIKLHKSLGGIRNLTKTWHPRHRDPRHELRPGRRPVPDPGQRRRHPFRRPVDPHHCGRRRRGPHPAPRQAGGRS
jgi:small subunit ribosomal protein S2